MGLFVSTTGTDVPIPELGITIPHPTTDYDVLSQFESLDVKKATNLTLNIRNGTLIWRKVAAGSIQPPTDYDADFSLVEEERNGPGATGDQAVIQTDLIAYLRRDGTSAMTGALNMGAFNITNVGTVDGVTISAHASRHLPSGADPLTTAAPATSLSATTTNAVGTANSLARSDHTHAIVTAAAIAQTPDQTNAVGSSANLARADHVHNIPTAAAVGLSATTTNTQGAGSTFARSDHTHAIASGVVSTQTPDQTNAIGTSANLARADHIHNIPTAAAITLDATTTNTQGAAATFARSNHTHAITTGAAIAQTPDQTNAVGTSASLARADHVHNIPTAAAVTISANANTQGNAATFARSNHTHQLTSTTALSEQSPVFDGSNWVPVYPEASRDMSTSMRVEDEFLGGLDGAVGFIGEMGWSVTNNGGSSGASLVASTSGNHPGKAQLSTGTSSTGRTSINLGTSQMTVGGGPLVVEMIVKMPVLGTGGQQYAVRIGLGDSTSAEPANGIYFQYANGVSGNVWAAKTSNASTRTTLTSAVAVVANTWYRLRFEVNAAATSIEFFVDGASIGTITTNISAADFSPFFHIMKSAGGTARTALVDYFLMYQRFTTPR